MPQVVTLRSDVQRAYACRLIAEAQDDSVVSISPPRRSADQNSKLWSMLTDISRQKPGGRVATPDTWKALAMHAAGFAVQFELGLNGQPFPSGYRTSRMTKAEMSLLIEWLFAYGAEVGIKWSEPHANKREQA